MNLSAIMLCSVMKAAKSCVSAALKSVSARLVYMHPNRGSTSMSLFQSGEALRTYAAVDRTCGPSHPLILYSERLNLLQEVDLANLREEGGVRSASLTSYNCPLSCDSKVVPSDPISFTYHWAFTYCDVPC